MKYIKTMTQLKLSIWLALYIGWFMNAAVFFRRFEGTLRSLPSGKDSQVQLS